LFDEFALRLLLFIKTNVGRWSDMSSSNMYTVHAGLEIDSEKGKTNQYAIKENRE